MVQTTVSVLIEGDEISFTKGLGGMCTIGNDIYTVVLSY